MNFNTAFARATEAEAAAAHLWVTRWRGWPDCTQDPRLIADYAVAKAEAELAGTNPFPISKSETVIEGARTAGA